MDFHHQNISTAMDFEGFLRVLYPSQDKYRIAAAWLVKEASEKSGIDGYELAKLCDEKSISRATMQKVFVRLRKLGMVERRSMKYYVNAEFSTATRRLGDAWRNLSQNKKFAFDETKLGINV